MPASIAHMLICDAARTQLAGGPEIPETDFKRFVAALEAHKAFMQLGSLGPDLPYYASMVKGLADLVFDRSDKPMGVDQWSYQLHSKDPNIFPLKMLEVIWRDSPDSTDDWDEEDKQRLAFACGFLTHVAADQIIHPLVNIFAGPYYKTGSDRVIHRKVEVMQDLCLYQELKGGSLLSAKPPPNEWCDPNPAWGCNTQPAFRYMLQKAFIEAHAVCPDEGEIEHWVDGILLVLRGLNNFGLYKSMSKSCDPGSPDRQRWYDSMNYRTQWFQQAVDLSTVYLTAALRFYSLGDTWDDNFRESFCRVVQNADLGAPMEQGILKRAQDGLAAWK